MRRHVGRLMPDDSIAMSEKFLIDHPQYAGQQWFWGANKRPVLLEEYLNDFPRKPGQEVDEEENALLPTLNVGLTWAAVEMAKSHGILEHLVEVFGKQLDKKLLYLAIYKLAGGTSMMTFDLWRQQNWLPEDTPLSGQKISEILAAVKKEQVLDYFKRRHRRQGEIWEKIFEKKPELKGQKSNTLWTAHPYRLIRNPLPKLSTDTLNAIPISSRLTSPWCVTNAQVTLFLHICTTVPSMTALHCLMF